MATKINMCLLEPLQWISRLTMAGEYLSIPQNPHRSKSFLSSQITASPMCCQLGFQPNWFGLISPGRSSSFLTFKEIPYYPSEIARIRSSSRRPFAKSGLHATRCSRNHFYSNEVKHSRSAKRVAFVMHKAQMVPLGVRRQKSCVSIKLGAAINRQAFSVQLIT